MIGNFPPLRADISCNRGQSVRCSLRVTLGASQASDHFNEMRFHAYQYRPTHAKFNDGGLIEAVVDDDTTHMNRRQQKLLYGFGTVGTQFLS